MANLVHLVRHGEVENPRHLVYGALPGFGLSDRGRLQARQAARYVARQPVVAVWSSPLERALETSHSIAALHQLPVRVNEDLTEWRLSERWSGVVWEDLPDRFPGEVESYLAQPWDLPFSPESLSDLAARVTAVIRDLNQRHPEGDVIVVGHQDPLQAAWLSLVGQSLEKLAENKPEHASVRTLRAGTPWTEKTRWSPESSEPFPPTN